MPNASRYLECGYTYHLTHRCHDRRFLLKFARDRDMYKKWLREGAVRYQIPIYNYCITSNHVHIIAHIENTEAVSAMIQLASATLARQWNRRKLHEGSFWEHPYKCTRIQNGVHLMRCLRYVSLNMVRAGIVAHPEQWRWCGHDELTGRRSRYRILAMARLLQSLDILTMESFRALYSSELDEMLKRRELRREVIWTESLAVGDRAFIDGVAADTENRQRFVYSPVTGSENTWSVCESDTGYNAKTSFKNKP